MIIVSYSWMVSCYNWVFISQHIWRDGVSYGVNVNKDNQYVMDDYEVVSCCLLLMLGDGVIGVELFAVLFVLMGLIFLLLGSVVLSCFVGCYWCYFLLFYNDSFFFCDFYWCACYLVLSFWMLCCFFFFFCFDFWLTFVLYYVYQDIILCSFGFFNEVLEVFITDCSEVINY